MTPTPHAIVLGTFRAFVIHSGVQQVVPMCQTLCQARGAVALNLPLRSSPWRQMVPARGTDAEGARPRTRSRKASKAQPDGKRVPWPGLECHSLLLGTALALERRCPCSWASEGGGAAAVSSKGTKAQESWMPCEPG